MLDTDKLKQDILQLIHDGCVTKLSQPVEYTAENISQIYNLLKRQACKAIESGEVLVSSDRKRIYMASPDDYLFMLPLIPMVYPEMLHSTCQVIANGGKVYGVAKYGGKVNETLLTNVFGVDTEFTFEDPIESIYMEVTIE